MERPFMGIASIDRMGQVNIQFSQEMAITGSAENSNETRRLDGSTQALT